MSIEEVILALHHTLLHLESPSTYACILYIDNSLTFNTINPEILFNKLFNMNTDPCIWYWIQNFLELEGYDE